MIPKPNTQKIVYQIWFETEIGPTFSSKEKAKEWLDSEYNGRREEWEETAEMYGYPFIAIILVDAPTQPCMDRSLMITFSYLDIQELSEKYFGDKLTRKELLELQRICNPDRWSRVDDGGWEGSLAHLIQAVVQLIGLVRGDRRGDESRKEYDNNL